MENILLTAPEYKIDQTAFGVWKRFMYSSGQSYAEFTSHRRVGKWPLLHYTSGLCPETGRRRMARGIVAVGRVAVGICAVGQAAFGVAAVGQLALGMLLGLGQLCTGLAALGQVSIGALALGQIAVGVVAVGQFGAGLYVLAQKGFGANVWDASHADLAAREFFRRLVFLGPPR